MRYINSLSSSLSLYHSHATKALVVMLPEGYMHVHVAAFKLFIVDRVVSSPGLA